MNRTTKSRRSKFKRNECLRCKNLSNGRTKFCDFHMIKNRKRNQKARNHAIAEDFRRVYEIDLIKKA